MTEPVVIAARRTPIGRDGGGLREYTVDELAAPVLRAALDDAGVDTVDDVVLGNVFGPGGNPARVAALRAGLGVGVPGVTVDRQCASGLAAIAQAAAAVRAGEGEAYLAGGVESASTAPQRAWRTDPPTPYSRAPFAPPEFGDPDMGPAADLVAAEAGISRERQDAFAARSHARAVAARSEGRFNRELVPVGGIAADERPRSGFTVERLARFRPAFTDGGTATAANSCGVNDGAAAVLVVSERLRARLGVPGLRLVASATRACDPARLGLGAVPAMRDVLGSVPDVVEFNEAFAGQTLACIDAVGIDEPAVSPDGGAIALGHPWGASGAVLVVRLFSRLVCQGMGSTGLAALSAGGGVGVATMWTVVR
ncbi:MULTISPECIES: thiolase family protein [Prauserella salsuginis group]|uniref:Thiolase family protein n=1 Tax=Prauserella salsuginis TaxID=387889 RepID=A0ABW6FX35_9PSEU|nr:MULTISPECIES: thiolase family protein [Prauserella salsuginis group]MCR3720553.1 acetyl-CoA C-acetyltransferase [Prauserella flava]MCR3733737.1 acetyl-CoA C-acetyltransferase [Prauserella salsuginis]